MTSIVSDTTTLIILGKLQRYDLLENLFKTIYIPSMVIKEIAKKSDGIEKLIQENNLFEIKEINNHSLLQILDGILDKGESEAIVLAKELELMLIIDEKKGRAIAKNMGLDIIGLLGIIILNLKRGFLSSNEAVTLLEDIKTTGFRISSKLEENFLKTIKGCK
jgi:predicted nucleic acid-binding protein